NLKNEDTATYFCARFLY
nr:immunoglobulin heavy chain junction region [Mus musculus]MBK4187052.1 immunoglobulin heavy chain junction region [Mus musculus]